ncbi:MAG: hypothetical protein IJH00_01090 [Erysipelotrichaceae bacterium]|nr:hypothetical protein [Erysipelotrichaceae bacterium]
MELLDEFTDQLHEWSTSGKEPLLASNDLRYFLDLQEKRLKNSSTIREEEFVHVKEEIKGHLDRKGNGYSSKILYREARQNITYLKDGKKVKKITRPVNLYVTFTDKEGYEDRECVCPNCGNSMSILKAREGCPYCGTFFETDDIYPCVSSYYTVPGIVERASLMGNLKREMLICASLFGLTAFLISFMHTYKDADILVRIFVSLFMSGLLAGLSAFLWYMMRSWLLLMRLFFEAGRALPMLKTLNSRNKMLKFMKKYDPDFSYEAFEGRIISLIRTIVFSDDRDTLSIYEGDNELSGFDDVVDMQYRGAVYIKRFEKIDDLLRVEGTAYLTDTYIDRRVHEKDEKIRFILQKEADGQNDPGFSIHRVNCSSCGGTFDAMHQRNCPYCGNPYDLKKKDWIVKDMKKV